MSVELCLNKVAFWNYSRYSKGFLDFQFSHLQALHQGLGPDGLLAEFLINLHFSASQAKAAFGLNRWKVSKMDISKLA